MNPIPPGSLLSVEVVIDDTEERFTSLDPDLSSYPKDMFWVFSACEEEWGNRHDLCPGDTKLRRGFSGHCVCGCHRGDTIHAAP